MIIIRNTLGTGTSFAQSANYPLQPNAPTLFLSFSVLTYYATHKMSLFVFSGTTLLCRLGGEKRRPQNIKRAVLFPLYKESITNFVYVPVVGGGGGGEFRARSLALFPTYTVNCAADVLIIAVHATVLCDWVGFPASAGLRVYAVQQCLRSAADLCWMNYWLI